MGDKHGVQAVQSGAQGLQTKFRSRVYEDPFSRIPADQHGGAVSGILRVRGAAYGTGAAQHGDAVAGSGA